MNTTICTHEVTHQETISKLIMRNGEADDYEDTVTVCDYCGETLDMEYDDFEPDYDEGDR